MMMQSRPGCPGDSNHLLRSTVAIFPVTVAFCIIDQILHHTIKVELPGMQSDCKLPKREGPYATKWQKQSQRI